ncbi:cytochrome P450 6B7-like [Epargyreus clarus]|uniref:cytochrome P450 6B7-like n=1 Tax=Epargyreus clarus TaxID=520877 RepID=UPI003C2C99D9
MLAILTFLCLLSIVLFLVFCLSKWKFDYWEKRGVPFIKPLPFFGNFKDYILQKKFEGYIAQELCQAFPDAPYVGAFFGTEPMLLVQDPELIKRVIAKDFYYFNGRAVSKYTHKEPFTQSLFFTSGDQWKVMRQNLTPLFSSAKMKNMFYLIENSTTSLSECLAKKTRKSSTIEVRSLMSRYTMDCIGSCAFGVNTNTLTHEDTSNPFFEMGNNIFETSRNRHLRVIGRLMWPAIFYGFGSKTFPTEISAFFKNLLLGVFETRQYKQTARHDFVDLILNLKENKYITGDSIHNLKTSEGKKIQLEANDDWLVGQCIGIFGAGFETSSTTLSFTLYELAKNQEAQTRAMVEIDEYLNKHEGKICYESISELPYLEACISEALRLYPVLGVISREVMEDYTFPTGLKLEKGLRVHIPAYHLHHNPDFFPEPEQYRPERFLPEEKDNIKPYTLLSFGEGPRICIGMRFAKMQIIPGLVTILKKYRVELAEDTPMRMELEPAAIATKPQGEIHLKFIPRME